jgi:hypothetical protein
MNFAPVPGYPLVFDGIEIPSTRSVGCIVDRKARRLLLLRILLMDAQTNTLLRVGEWDQNKQYLELSLVDFQAKHNVIDLHDRKATVRFRLPCCFLDSMGRTVRYR